MVTGIIICNAHRQVALLYYFYVTYNFNHKRVSESSLESFVIRLFREENKEGFVKAFSENAEAIVNLGFAGLEKCLRNLFLKQVFFWPRFQVDLAKELDGASAEVIELRVPLTRKMKEIQFSILSVMDTCIKVGSTLPMMKVCYKLL